MPSSTVDARTPSLPSPSAILELLKPVTWFPPMWAFGCGIVSSGQALTGHGWTIFLGILLTGPLVCATSQAVNDWFDREVDAINEPDRPIPSGRIPGRWGLYIGIVWTCLSLLVAAWLGKVVLVAAVIGLVLAWVYSAPPLRLKQNGWWGNAAVGLCYEGLPWITGVAVLAAGGAVDGRLIFLALIYSAGAHGIMTLNDFKSIEGDKALGLKSLPVQLGVQGAARLACLLMALAQCAVIVALLIWQQSLYAAAIAVFVIVQLFLMRRLLSDPRRWAPWYNATGISLYVLGMLVSSFAMRGLISGG